jgi:ABC-type sulfate/molybdate transport systems ATPase subunit
VGDCYDSRRLEFFFDSAGLIKGRILVTHAVEFLHIADRVVIMNEGRIQA